MNKITIILGMSNYEKERAPTRGKERMEKSLSMQIDKWGPVLLRDIFYELFNNEKEKIIITGTREKIDDGFEDGDKYQLYIEKL